MGTLDSMTYQEAADYIGTTVGALRAAVYRGDLNVFHPTRSKYKKLRREDVERYKNGERANSRTRVQQGEPPTYPAEQSVQVSSNVPPAQRDLLTVLLSAASSFYLHLKEKSAEQDRVIVGGYNTSLERIGAIVQYPGTAGTAPEWMQRFMGTPNPTREQALEMLDHAPEMMQTVFPGAEEIPPEMQPFVKDALAAGLNTIWDRLEHLRREREGADEPAREKVPA